MKEMEELWDCLDRLEEGYCSLTHENAACFLADATLIQTKARLEVVLGRIENSLSTNQRGNCE